MPDLLLHEARLVVLDQRDNVLAGNVAEVDDREAVGVEIPPDRTHAAARDGRPNRAAIQHAREHEVVGIDRPARCLADTVLPRDAPSNRALTEARHLAKMR